MKPDSRFLAQPMTFWADVRTISEKVGYTDRRTSAIRVPTLDDIRTVYRGLGLDMHHLENASGPTQYGTVLMDYFQYRASVLNSQVEAHLMDFEEANERFYDLLARRGLSMDLQARAFLYPNGNVLDVPLATNKQKGTKAGPALLTNAVNLLIHEGLDGRGCDYDPRSLTTFTRSRLPLRTLARRVDGAFPAVVNPVAIWEIKEYYFTTTFGSRVADGVYETLLDGLELDEMRRAEDVDCLHYLFVDSHFTWWRSGRSYLCRMVDIMHMSLVDEVVFGSEVYIRIPDIVNEWILRLAPGNGVRS